MKGISLELRVRKTCVLGKLMISALILDRLQIETVLVKAEVKKYHLLSMMYLITICQRKSKSKRTLSKT
jgi:hypothetical protein